LGSQSQISELSRRSTWNPAFDAILKSGAKHGPSRLSKSIERIREQDSNLNIRTILKRTAELKLTSWKSPWTEWEKSFVLEHAREFPVADIARRLGRTPRAVYLLLSRTGQSARFQDGYTQMQLAEALHVSRRKVRQWIRSGWLALYEGRVKDRSLKSFLDGHSNEIDADRLERDVKFWLGDLGFHPDAAHSCRWISERKQSLKLHVCGRCGRKVYGNSFHRHRRACAKKALAATYETDNCISRARQ
jgi:transcriptional regulator with XRE-family HTH domain